MPLPIQPTAVLAQILGDTHVRSMSRATMRIRIVARRAAIGRVELPRPFASKVTNGHGLWESSALAVPLVRGKTLSR